MIRQEPRDPGEKWAISTKCAMHVQLYQSSVCTKCLEAQAIASDTSLQQQSAPKILKITTTLPW